MVGFVGQLVRVVVHAEWQTEASPSTQEFVFGMFVLLR